MIESSTGENHRIFTGHLTAIRVVSRGQIERMIAGGKTDKASSILSPHAKRQHDLVGPQTRVVVEAQNRVGFHVLERQEAVIEAVAVGFEHDETASAQIGCESSREFAARLCLLVVPNHHDRVQIWVF